MLKENPEIQSFDWSNLDGEEAYQRWRSAKLKTADEAMNWGPVQIDNLSHTTDSERTSLKERCRLTNYAHYASAAPSGDSDAAELALRDFAAAMGLHLAETHRSAGKSGIVALQVSEEPSKRGYIPYSNRAMNWHTEGCYNAPDDYIGGFVLHCVRPAAEGGVTQLLDPEIAYIRLRDRDPALLRALMHPKAMSIPENREPDGTLRPVSVGPVFFADPITGRLQMRYTARTRSIAWRDDPATRQAEAFLRQYLPGGDPLMPQVKLGAGQGVLNNNILHNRTGFAVGAGPGRLLYRVRFRNRIEGS